MSRIYTPEDLWPDLTPEERQERCEALWNETEDDEDDGL